MPTIYDLKPAFQRLLRPLANGLVKAGVTPNQVTVLALLLSLATGAAIALRPAERWPLLLVPGMLFLRMALNALDGMMAREHGLTSRLGGLLNEIGDVVSDSALYLPLALVPGFDSRLVVAAVLLAALTELAGVAAVAIGSSRRYDGPMGKSDRAFVFGALCLALGLGAAPGRWLFWLLLAVAALAAWTVINRARRALLEPAP